MKILVIAAHPDDEVYGMGGTIAKLTFKGNEVYTLIVTEGCSTQYKGNLEILEQKKQEAIKSNEILGVKTVIFGNLPDMLLDTIPHIQINAVIEDALQQIKPDIVYTHHKGDVNKDHRMVYESTMVAVRPIITQSVKKVICYQVPSSSEWSGPFAEDIFIPNIFEDIESTYEQKQKSLLEYQTEIREYPHPRSLECVLALDTSVGLKIGIGKAEAFQLIRLINI